MSNRVTNDCVTNIPENENVAVAPAVEAPCRVLLKDPGVSFWLQPEEYCTDESLSSIVADMARAWVGRTTRGKEQRGAFWRGVK